MIKSLKHWIADRSELIWRAEYAERQLVQADYVLAAKHDAMISASERSERLAAELSKWKDADERVAEGLERMGIPRDGGPIDVTFGEKALYLASGIDQDRTDLTAERDAALAKLAPPARDPVTGRWAKAS
jgi:hypothetical protein